MSALLIRAFFMAEEVRGQPERLGYKHMLKTSGSGRAAGGQEPSLFLTHLRWVRKLPLTCPEPSQPGVGHVIPSVFPAFQTNCEPFM